ncbi:MAG: redoxin family protein [Candidatus Delongbacteria bacterium]|nr:redoxin family protein [Candidatus Delongbacteria bacterium]
MFYPEVEQRSVIIGHITNINEFSDAPRNIELQVDDITIDYPQMFKTEINENGDFKFDIPLFHSINTYLSYDDGRITPYIFPNDTLTMKCEIEKDGFKFRIKNVGFDSKHDKFQKEFFKQHEWIHYNQLGNFRDTLSIELTPEQYKNQLLDFEQVILNRIKYKIEKDSLNESLSNYLINSAKYSLYGDILRKSKELEKLEERKQLLSFLADSVVFNNEAMLTASYNTFLNSYNFTLEPREGFGIETNGKTKEQVQWEMMNGLIENDFKRRDRIWAEFLGATFVYNSISKDRITQSEINLYTRLIQERFTEIYIRQLLLSMCKQINQKVDETENLSIPKDAILSKYESNSGEEIFSKIIENNKGKVIYVDIWATWCSPCIKLFNHSQRMHEMFNNENITFVYLCCRSSEENWKNVIKRHQVIGTHILLNQKQNDELQTMFSIDALPQFVLIDSDGKIVNNHAPKPDSEEILNDIKKLLKRK